jgi:hypothetical protein
MKTLALRFIPPSPRTAAAHSKTGFSLMDERVAPAPIDRAEAERRRTAFSLLFPRLEALAGGEEHHGIEPNHPDPLRVSGAIRAQPDTPTSRL